MPDGQVSHNQRAEDADRKMSKGLNRRIRRSGREFEPT